MALVCISTLFSSCEKVPQGGEMADPNAEFLGEYALTVDYITYMDGVLQEETGHWNGSLTVMSDGSVDGVEVEGVVALSGQQVLLYKSSGRVDVATGTLKLDNSTMRVESSGLVANIEYEPFVYAEPLVFHSTFSTTLSGYAVRYEMTNTAVRK